MKKIKRIMAMLLAMVMVLGMTVSTMAAPNSATITIKDEKYNNLQGAELLYVQIIKADQTTPTGWAFTSTEIEQAYSEAFEEDDAQVIIEQLIAYAEGKDANDGAATSEEIAKALSLLANRKTPYVEMANPQTVTEAGVYAIKATQVGYTYNNMAAYVGFGTVDGAYPSLLDTELTAKRTPVDLDKEVTDPDKVVAIGDTVTYTIETTVPFIDPGAKDKAFKVWDKITGAEYYFEGEGSHFSITMGDFEKVSAKPVVEGNGFTVDLSELILADNSNAGKTVLIAYTAKVTSQTVKNEAGSNVSGDDVDTSDEDIYSGSIMLTKFNEDESEQLEGAGFEVTKENSDEVLTFAQNTEGHYTYDPEGKITEVFTGPDGTLVLAGLDLGTYNFKETTAPEGYHVKNDPSGIDATATLKLGENETEATKIVTTDTKLTNTKLSSLPSTGGIGTTIFTIGGCVIMIAAAGLFFASRRKTAK
ncbi:MAG: SpaH/EbpB family LPXTG-anchored major pilin [Oliverpabstia sp.]|nr:SpaH/EbpB family LPXTG-anchored major pilin [Oliverpabstia sp.]